MCSEPGVFEFGKRSFVFKSNDGIGAATVVRSGGTDGNIRLPWFMKSLDKPSVFDGKYGRVFA